MLAVNTAVVWCALLQVKYRMAGEVARTICHVDEKAWDIEHAKKVSQQVSKVSEFWLTRRLVNVNGS